MVTRPALNQSDTITHSKVYSSEAEHIKILFFLAFIDRTVQRGDKKWDEREGGMTCSRGLQVSLQLWATAARTGPIFT